MKSSISLWIGWLFAVSVIFFPATALPDELIRRLYEEGMPAWENSIAILSRQPVAIHDETGNLVGGWKLPYRMLQSKVQGVSDSGDVDSASEWVLIARNPRYAFWLCKQSREANWTLRGVNDLEAKVPSDPTLHDIIQSSFADTPRSFLEFGYGLGARMYLLDLLSDASTRIVSAQIIREGDQELLEYSWEVGNDSSKYPALGVFVVAPHLKWAVVRVKWNSVAADPERVVLEAENLDFISLHGIYVPQVVRAKLSRNHGRQVEQVNTAMKYSPEFKPQWCYLSHYGLPEPDWYRPPPPYWLYLGIAAVVLVMVGLVIMHFANNRR